MNDVLWPWAERTDTVDGAELDADDDRLLAAPCEAPGCPLRNGDHSPEEVSVCLERWLMALEREAGR
jgi:hypothetical protein